MLHIELTMWWWEHKLKLPTSMCMILCIKLPHDWWIIAWQSRCTRVWLMGFLTVQHPLSWWFSQESRRASTESHIQFNSIQIDLYGAKSLHTLSQGSKISNSISNGYHLDYRLDKQVRRGFLMLYRFSLRKTSIFFQASSWARECATISPPHRCTTEKTKGHRNSCQSSREFLWLSTAS